MCDSRLVANIPIDEQQLLEKAARWPALGSLSQLNLASLQQLSQNEGIDFSTALLYHRLCRSAEHAATIAQIQTTPVPVDADLPQLDALVAIVPGAFFREANTESGADGRSIRELVRKFGCASEVVPLRSFGSLLENARILGDWLERHAASKRPIILVSLSKAGAEVKLALGATNASRAFKPVIAWINLSGLLHGTPLVAWLRKRPLRTSLIRLLFWKQGHEFAAVRQLDRGPGTPLDCKLVIPNHMQALHVVGFPLRRHLSSRLSRRGHSRLADYGPNDGIGNLLIDLCRLPGAIYPIWGADHYLRPDGEDAAQIVRRILIYWHTTGIVSATSELALTGEPK